MVLKMCTDSSFSAASFVTTCFIFGWACSFPLGPQPKADALESLSKGELTDALSADTLSRNRSSEIADPVADDLEAEESSEAQLQRTWTLMEEALRRGGRKPIYGVDERQDWGEFRFDPRIRKRGKASVAMFLLNNVTTTPERGAVVKKRSLGDKLRLCRGEPFVRQNATAYCSGVLVRSNIVLTAGHCIQNRISASGTTPSRREVHFVFGYFAKPDNEFGLTEFEPSRVFRARKVLARKFDEAKGVDWAVVELDRPVPSEIASPFTSFSEQPVEQGEGVYVIGYPSGLPVKYAPGAKVRSVEKEKYFVANLDAFGGNSGSPVFSARTHSLVGILVRGRADYVKDRRKNCRRAFVCPTTGCAGEHVMRIEKIDFSEALRQCEKCD